MFDLLQCITFIILLLVIVGCLVVREENGIGNMVTVLLHQLLNLPSVGIFTAFLVQVENDGRTLAFALCFIKGITPLAGTAPLPSLFLTSLSADYLNLFCNHEGAVETYTKLANEVTVLLLLLSKGSKELLGSTGCNGAQVVCQVVMTHAKT